MIPETHYAASAEDQNDVGLTPRKPQFDLGSAQVRFVDKVTLGLVFLGVLLQVSPVRIISTMLNPHLSQTPHKLGYSQSRYITQNMERGRLFVREAVIASIGTAERMSHSYAHNKV